MKTINYLSLFISFIMLASCKKVDKAVTKPVSFTGTTYETLGTFDDFGKPNYLLTKDAISSDMLSFINNLLPERADVRSSHPDLLNSTAIGDIDITQASDVFITFVTQGSGLTNAFAFYTYPTSTPPASAKDIVKIIYAFPNAGAGTTLEAGDKVKIGRFNAGTSIGFVLLNGGWKSETKQLDNKAVHFCSNDVLNPEVAANLKKHAVLINYAPENKVLIGFEDLDRTRNDCDHDFNDVVLYATVTP
jgi:hypothetical protein